MTNAPFVLNVDCDMFANNPQVVLHAMCMLLGFPDEVNSAFAQAPQHFHSALKDDPFGNQLVVLQQVCTHASYSSSHINKAITYSARRDSLCKRLITVCLQSFQSVTPGLQAMQGSFYAGTGCFQRRKVIYGVPPNGSRLKKKGDRYISRLQLLECSLKNNSTEMLSHEALRLFYGNSMEFMQSAVQITAGISSPGLPADLTSRVAAAKMVASSSYEFNTAWGDEVCITSRNSNFLLLGNFIIISKLISFRLQIGWVYGSMTEDILTGLRCHCMGWRTVSLMLDPPAFLGSAPIGGPASLTQYKRWATGLLEILVSKKSPVVSVITKELMFRQCLAYLVIIVWAVRSIFEICYALLPAYCLLSNSTFLPKVRHKQFYSVMH